MKKFLKKIYKILKSDYSNENYLNAQKKLDEIKLQFELKYNCEYNEMIKVELINEDK